MKIEKFNEARIPKQKDPFLGETTMKIETDIIFRVSASRERPDRYSLRLKIPGLNLGDYGWYLVGTGLTMPELEDRKMKLLSEISNFHKDVNKYNL